MGHNESVMDGQFRKKKKPNLKGDNVCGRGEAGDSGGKAKSVALKLNSPAVKEKKRAQAPVSQSTSGRLRLQKDTVWNETRKTSSYGR